MGRPPTWTDEQLADAVVGAMSWAVVARRLGMNAYGKTTTRLRRHAVRLNLDVCHLDKVRTVVSAAPKPDRWSVEPDQLRKALAESRSWAEVLGALGMPLWGSNYAKVQKLAREIDADVTKLLGQAWGSSPIRPLPVPFSRPFDQTRLHQVGTAMATSWFLAHGYMASVPGELDLFFIYTLAGSMYLIPFAAVAGMTALRLKKYANYLLPDDSMLL